MYLARDLELGTLRAVKVLPLASSREAKLLRLLEHPSLPKMFDFAEKDDCCYLVMEYIHGKSFAQHLREGKEFSMKEILFAGRTVLDILGYLHTRKPAVCYGDMKPDNLMLSETGRIYLVDFGSAVTVRGIYPRECKGTVGYAAPEQYKGKMSAASDLYGLGKTLEKLCGRNRLKYFLMYPQFGYFIWKCCLTDEKKRWKNAGEAALYLEKIEPVKIKLKTALFPAAGILAVVVLLLMTGGHGHKEMPVMEQILSPVTACYYSFEYRSGSRELRTAAELNIEKILQRLMKVYSNKEDQIRILELLALNGELQDAPEKAEAYDSQLLMYEPEYGNGYIKYGRYLCRQNKTDESSEILNKLKEKQKENIEIQKNTDQEALRLWEEELDS